MAKASGIETPTREDLARLDRKRKKRTSNQEWKSPSDEDARIAMMRNGSTHLAYKAEHAVDMDSGAVVVTLQAADLGDTTTVCQTLAEAGTVVAELVGREAELHPEQEPKVNGDGIEELVADKVRGHDNILKRLLIHVGAFNISLIRKMLGAGTPRELKKRTVRLVFRNCEWLTCNDLPVGAIKSSNAPFLARYSPVNQTRISPHLDFSYLHHGC